METFIPKYPPSYIELVAEFTPLKIYNGTPLGSLNRDLRATLPINELKDKPPTEVCPILNLHRCKETYSSASSFLNEFPDMNYYVQSSRNSAEIIERANIVIVNARNILGWKSDNNSYNVNIKCIVDDPRMHELNNVKDNQKKLKLIIMCMVDYIMIVMEDTILKWVSKEKSEEIRDMIYKYAEE